MIIRTTDGLKAVKDILAKGLTFSYDVETTGLNVRHDKIIGFGCASLDSDDAFYIITKEYNGTELVDVISDVDVLPIIQILTKKRLIMHNASYDCRITHHYYGVNLIDSLYADTMILAHTVNENKREYKLKTLTAELFGANVTAEKQDMLDSIKANGGTDKEFYKADSALMAAYGLQDNRLTIRLFKHYDKLLRAQGLYSFFYDIEVMPLLKTTTINLELKGIPVDVSTMQATLVEITAEMQIIEDSIQAQIAPLLTEFNEWFINKSYPVALSGHFLNTVATLIAPSDWPKTKAGTYSFSTAAFKKKPQLLEHDLMLYKTGTKRLPKELVAQTQSKLHTESAIKYPFNILSKDHLKRLLFAKLNEMPMSKTDLGSPQVDDALLDVLAEKYDWIRQLRTYNKLTKIKSTYIERFLEKQEAGIFYPSYFMHRTTSGRFSGDLQQMPRIKTLEDENDPIFLKYNNRIRNFFISGEGKKLVDADYESLEVVVFADDSQDEALLDVIRNNFDLYSQVAINVFGESDYSADKKSPMFLKKHKPELRQQAKAFALGFRYNLQPYKLSKDLGISESQAERLQREYFKSYPRLRERMNEIVAEAKTNGKIKSKGGRVRNLPGLVENLEKYGEILFDGLELWKQYNDNVNQYAKMKEVAKNCRGAVNNSLNFPIQSFAASIVSRASIEISKEFKKRGMESYICLSVHDEICLLSPDSEVEEAAKIMQDKMENTTVLSVPLKAEPIIGTCYGEVK